MHPIIMTISALSFTDEDPRFVYVRTFVDRRHHLPCSFLRRELQAVQGLARFVQDSGLEQAVIAHLDLAKVEVFTGERGARGVENGRIERLVTRAAPRA